MHFEKVISDGENNSRKDKLLFLKDSADGDVAGHLVNGRGPGVTEAEGVGVAVRPRPAEMTEFLTGQKSATDLLAVSRNGTGQRHVLLSGTAELVTSYDGNGKVEIAGRLKNGEFVEHGPTAKIIGRLLGSASEVVS